MEAYTSAISHPIAIAPAPARVPSTEPDNGQDPDSTTKRFNCQTCVRKKVKCDKAVPVCASCRKGRLQCIYQTPPPRKRKRTNLEDVHERLARYERILQENDLLPTALGSPASSNTRTRDPTPAPTASQLAAAPKVGKLLSTDGKSRYIDNVLLLDAGEGDLCELSDSDQDVCNEDNTRPGQSGSANLGFLAGDTVAQAMLGGSKNLIEYHPSHEEAMKLWDAYVQNVDPLCKVLHVPTVAKMVQTVSKQPTIASKGDECLLFAIYYFAVFSMADVECIQVFNKTRHELTSKYQDAVRQALANAAWLKTTAMPVLQAYILFLIAIRTQVDPQTFWILTGIAVRLAQRMGLHRDGENLGLPPFEVQMRRRLFWQLLPLDGYAGQVSGTGISISPSSWDTKQPLNINDDQIYPGMAEQPEEQRGASEMIFCLTRIELSNFYTRTGVKMKDVGATIQFRGAEDIERLIDEVEGLIEMKYLRYCDILNPLHILTLGIVRSAINAVRLRNRMPPLIKQTISDCQRRDLCTLAQKILDTDSAIYGNPNMKKFQWQMKAFFLWDALLCILFSLAKPGFFSTSELKTTWSKIEEVYSNHEELVKGKRALHFTIGKVTLKAWLANPPGDSMPEPDFITTLRTQLAPKVSRAQETVSEPGSNDSVVDDIPSFDGLFGSVDGADLNLNNNFSLSSSDWMFWDQLGLGANPS
ncbi:activator of stress protein 1 [Arthroderma uncinatum]|uniref:activator of stress protein 1 n=1 Tax=Arthroderma uncinatum TaxID=74035 RepID=UPI00144ADE9A|nr:activator of stress protein 1 [Arthroderma uncinatum]KAF3481323.1 activator of stress protein 1 [Arthroderma uncinatum]